MLMLMWCLLIAHYSFLVCVCTVLGDMLSKRPATKKVESFMASQVKAKVDSMILDSQIQSKCLLFHSLYS